VARQAQGFTIPLEFTALIAFSGRGGLVVAVPTLLWASQGRRDEAPGIRPNNPNRRLFGQERQQNDARSVEVIGVKAGAMLVPIPVSMTEPA
jgi:hypothetical protein